MEKKSHEEYDSDDEFDASAPTLKQAVDEMDDEFLNSKTFILCVADSNEGGANKIQGKIETIMALFAQGVSELSPPYNAIVAHHIIRYVPPKLLMEVATEFLSKDINEYMMENIKPEGNA